MSWSMIDFGAYWAPAHDAEQVLFMSFAAKFLDSSAEFSDVSWLQAWKAYWLDHEKTYGNGCSDIALTRFLDSEAKLRQFRNFLHQFQS